MKPEQIVTAARAYLNAPWKHQGRSAQGIDCAGLIIAVARDLDLSEFDTRDYSRQAMDESMLDLCREHLEQVPRDGAMPGDVAVLRFGSNRHIGIFGDYPHGGLSLIHAYSHHPRRVVEHRFHAEWLQAVQASWLATFRFPGVSA